jgi:hypothetical protein
MGCSIVMDGFLLKGKACLFRIIGINEFCRRCQILTRAFALVVAAVTENLVL